MYYVCLVLLGYGLYIVHGFVNLVVASLKPPHFGCKNELVGDPKKKVLAPLWVELMWYTVYCSSSLPFFIFGKPNK